MAEDLNISYESTQHILVNALDMKRVIARLVSKVLNLLQKRRRVEVASRKSDSWQRSWGRYIHQIIAGGFSERRSNNKPKPKKTRQSRCRIKVMLIVFCDYHGVVNHEFVSQGQTANTEYYCIYAFWGLYSQDLASCDCFLF